MNKPVQNYVLDWFSLVLLVALAATGMLMGYALPSGNGGATVLGIGRHDWGEVHLWIAWGFITVVVIHLLMHAGWIKALTLGTKPGRARVWRATGAVAATAVMVAVVVMAALAPSTPGTGRGEGGGEGRGRGSEWSASEGGGQVDSQDHAPGQGRGRGRNRLAE